MSHAREARQLLRAHFYGVLSTHSARFEGYPFGSIVPYITDYDGSVILFISALAEHTKNIAKNARVSLITHDQNDPRIQTQGRVTVIGRAEAAISRSIYAARWLRHFPESAQLMELGDFGFYRMVPEAARHIVGFGQARWISSHFTVTPYPLIEEAEHFLEHINTHRPEVLVQYLQTQDMRPSQARIVAIDCDGATIVADGKLVRLDFPDHAPDSGTVLAIMRNLGNAPSP